MVYYEKSIHIHLESKILLVFNNCFVCGGQVHAALPASEDKYKVVSPETMQETFISDSEDEGGEVYGIFHINFL